MIIVDAKPLPGHGDNDGPRISLYEGTQVSLPAGPADTAYMLTHMFVQFCGHSLP